MGLLGGRDAGGFLFAFSVWCSTCQCTVEEEEEEERGEQAVEAGF